MNFSSKLDNGSTDKNMLSNVIKSLEKVPANINKIVFDIHNSMSELEVIQSFNQQTLDLFSLVTFITNKMNRSKEYNFSAYKQLFDTAIKINVKFPIDQFALSILVFSADIYSENEEIFLNMDLPDKKLNIGNEFSMIRSEEFKTLWKKLGETDKKSIKDQIILLTIYAHAYFYKAIIK